MSRPTYWECGRELVYYMGELVFKTYADQIGNEHRMHKQCFEQGGYANKPLTIDVTNETTDISGRYSL